MRISPYGINLDQSTHQCRDNTCWDDTVQWGSLARAFDAFILLMEDYNCCLSRLYYMGP